MDTADIENAKTFSQTGNERTIQEVISKLRFISKIKPNDKVNVKSLFVRNNELIWQRLIRTIRNLSAEDGESKDSTMTFLKMVTDEAINLICIYKKDVENAFNISIANLIITNLEECVTGMQSLLETYKADSNFISKLEALIGTLTLRIKTLQQNSILVQDD